MGVWRAALGDRIFGCRQRQRRLERQTCREAYLPCAVRDFGFAADYRVKDGAALGASGKTRHKTMTLAPEESMRRFLLHVLRAGFHRIGHCGLLANGGRRANLALASELLGASKPQPAASNSEDAGTKSPTFTCRHCGRALLVVQTIIRGQSIRAPPPRLV